MIQNHLVEQETRERRATRSRKSGKKTSLSTTLLRMKTGRQSRSWDARVLVAKAQDARRVQHAGQVQRDLRVLGGPRVQSGQKVPEKERKLSKKPLSLSPLWLRPGSTTLQTQCPVVAQWPTPTTQVIEHPLKIHQGRKLMLSSPGLEEMTQLWEPQHKWFWKVIPQSVRLRASVQ